MTAISDTVTLISARHEPVVTAYSMVDATFAELAQEALDTLGIDGAAAALESADLPSMRLAIDVVVWRWVEARAALGFDFSADGGSYQRSQLAKQAAEMRRKAEDRAAAAGMDAYEWPAIEYDMPVNKLTSDEWGTDAGLYQW